MSWKENYFDERHDMFIAFIELKIKGSWVDSSRRNLNRKGDFLFSMGQGSVVVT